MAGGARLRVRIDVQRVRSNMEMHGRKLTPVGFEPEAGPASPDEVGAPAAAWLTDAENLRCLDRSEILAVAPAS